MANDLVFIDRSPSGLVDAVCARIKTALRSFWQENEHGEDQEPNVHAQYLPVTKTEEEERDKTKDYPLVQVVCTAGTVSSFAPTATGSEITLMIYFGGFRNDPDNQGWRIPVTMLWRVMQDFLEDTIIGGYQIVTPIKWTPLNNREPPYYTAQMETHWQGANPAIETPFEGVATSNNGSEEKFGST